jgi:hypothetical protein
MALPGNDAPETVDPETVEPETVEADFEDSSVTLQE